jgi:hypothetical protein
MLQTLRAPINRHFCNRTQCFPLSQVRTDDLLKISQTSLEEILMQEGNFAAPALSRQNSGVSAAGSTSASSSAIKGGDRKRKRDPMLEQLLDLSSVPEEARQEVLSRLKSMGMNVDAFDAATGLLRTTSQDNLSALDRDADLDDVEEGDSEDSDVEDMDDEGSEDDASEGADEAKDSLASSQVTSQPDGEPSTPAKKVPRTLEAISTATVGFQLPTSSPQGPSTTPTGEASALKPYPADGQLEFLEDCFQTIALMIKGNVARMKDDMKKEGAASRYNSYEGAGELKHSRRELVAKLRLQESRVQVRLKKTAEAGHPLPRLEVMNQRFQLDPFEKKIILLLIGEHDTLADELIKLCLLEVHSSEKNVYHFLCRQDRLADCEDAHGHAGHLAQPRGGRSDRRPGALHPLSGLPLPDRPPPVLLPVRAAADERDRQPVQV